MGSERGPGQLWSLIAALVITPIPPQAPMCPLRAPRKLGPGPSAVNQPSGVPSLRIVPVGSTHSAPSRFLPLYPPWFPNVFTPQSEDILASTEACEPAWIGVVNRPTFMASALSSAQVT